MIAEARHSILDVDAIDAIRDGKRPDGDVYPTPRWAVEQILGALRLFPSRDHLQVLDPGAGSGAWGFTAAILLQCDVWGVERRDMAQPVNYDEWDADTDFLTWSSRSVYRGQPAVRFDLIVGNPPYSLAEAFIRHSRDLLAPGGQIVFLLRLAFLEGQARAKGLWTEFPPERVLVLPKRPSFSANGKTDAIAYAAFYWRDGFRGSPALGWLS